MFCSLLIAALSVVSSTPLWPEGMMPYAQAHQTEAPRIEWLGPAKPTTDACLLLVPGGAYMTCNPSKWLDLVAARYMAKGVTCCRLRYRTPRPKGIPIWKTACADGQRAVRLLRREAAARGYDPEKIAAFGFSAGGNLVLTLATSSQTPLYEPVDETDALSAHLNRAIPVYPAYVLSDGFLGPNERRGEGADVSVSDQFKFDGKTPPVCFFHGGADEYSPNGSTRVYRELKARGVSAELHLYADGGHGFFAGAKPGTGGANYLDRVDEWFVETEFLGPKPAAVAWNVHYDTKATARREKVNLWPEGQMPLVATNQTVLPYIEWFEPRQRTTKAVVIVTPGGAYNGWSGRSEGAEIAGWYNGKGMTAVVLRYRTPRPVGLPYFAPARADAQRAVRLVRAAAPARGLDPDAIGMTGFSAGGHLTLLTATASRSAAYRAVDKTDEISAKLNWAIPVYPAYVLSGERISDELVFDPDTPQMCFFHGDRDGITSLGSVTAWERLRRMGIQGDLHVFAGQGHCFHFNAVPGTGAYDWLDCAWEWLVHIGLTSDEPKRDVVHVSCH